MHPADLLRPVVLGLVEGLTEFVPVSSTGHLILAERAMAYDGRQARVVDVVIQVGAIMAVCWLYRGSLFDVILTLPSRPASRRFAIAVTLAFLPAAIVGALAHDFIKHVLFSLWVVVASLIVGGLAILLIEHLVPDRGRWQGVEAIPFGVAFGIGVCQLLSLVLGVSRSGATIMGGISLGVDRRTATEFSFFLAIPTMVGAAAFDLFKNRSILSADDLVAVAVGTVTSFLVGLVVVRRLVSFVGKHGVTFFGWYRIAAGLAAFGWLAFSR